MAVATAVVPIFHFPLQPSPLQIPAARPIQVDGTISTGAWDDAGSVNVQVEPEWSVTVLYKHDAEHLE